MGIVVPQVSLAEAKKFSQVWNSNGVAVIIDEPALQFATDFANVVLRSFVVEQYVRAAAVMEAAKNQSKIVEA